MKIHFGGVKWNSQAYVNGREVGGNLGGYEPFDVDITDAVVLCLHLVDGREVGCLEALDVDRNRYVSVADAVEILRFRFARGMAPEQPFPACGRLETPRPTLSCERSFCE